MIIVTMTIVPQGTPEYPYSGPGPGRAASLSRMNKIYGVLAGSAVAGAATGWMARVLWLWSIAEEERSCADSVTL
ncbi:hypothetical protein GCM10010425_23070 [Streptomyces spororaveus]